MISKTDNIPFLYDIPLYAVLIAPPPLPPPLPLCCVVALHFVFVYNRVLTPRVG